MFLEFCTIWLSIHVSTGEVSRVPVLPIVPQQRVAAFHQNEALNVMSRNQEGVCFSEIKALQGAMLAAKNIYQDNDSQGNM